MFKYLDMPFEDGKVHEINPALGERSPKKTNDYDINIDIHRSRLPFKTPDVLSMSKQCPAEYFLPYAYFQTERINAKCMYGSNCKLGDRCPYIHQ